MAKKADDDKMVDQSSAQEGGEEPTWVYRWDAALHELGSKVVHEYTPMLADVEILYLFTSKVRKSRGKVIAGQTIKLNPFQRFLDAGKEATYDGSDFAIIISWDWWLEHTNLKDRRTLLHHQLAYIWREENDDGDVKWVLRHPVSEFPEVASAHGAWHEDLVMLSNALQQLPLPL